MRGPRSAPWPGAVAALLLAPSLAAAGPLTWGFRAEAPDGTVLRDVTGLTDLAYSDLFLPDPRTHGTYAGGDTRPAAGYYSDVWETGATVTITDGRTGESGTFELWWAWTQDYDIRPDGTAEPIYEGYVSFPWPDPVRLTLGGTVYEARGPGGELHVNVTPGVATPEPTTLALAGVGLCPLIARVARRRTLPCA